MNNGEFRKRFLKLLSESMDEDLDKVNIEDLSPSLIHSEVHFIKDVRKIMPFRRENLTATQMCWITKKPVIDIGNSVYNPKALIMLILN